MNGSILAVIAVSLLMVYLNKSSKNKPEYNAEGAFILKMNKVYSIIGWISIVISIGVGFLASMEFLNIINIGGLDVLTVFCIICFLTGILLISSSKIRVIITEYQISYYGIFRKVKVIDWKNINSVSFNRVGLELTLKTNETKIKLHMHLVGIDTFIEMIKRKLEPSLYENVLTEISKIDNDW